MKKIFVSALIVVLGLAMSAADASAQGMRGGRGDSRRVEHNSGGSRPGRGNSGGNFGSRPGNTSRPGNASRPGTSSRPGNNGGNHNFGGNHNNGGNHNVGGGSSFRPGNNHNNNGGGNKHDGAGSNFRPGNNGNHGNNQGYRPGNGNSFRPGNNGNHGNNQGYRPGNNHGYRPGNNNGFRPGNSYRPGHGGMAGPMRPGVSRPPVWHRPYRPGLAPARPFFRPTPPRHWHAPRYRVNLWSNILGVTIGMTINNAIDRLLYDGYTVTGYNGNEIYLTNVPMYNYYWPDATMYYNSGAFMGSRFFYSTVGYDTLRFRQMYDYFGALYGEPVEMLRTAEGATATWYGSDNQFITLDFGPQLTDAGRRYFTTISIGL